MEELKKLEKRVSVLESWVGWAIGFGVVAFFFLILHAYAGGHP